MTDVAATGELYEKRGTTDPPVIVIPYSVWRKCCEMRDTLEEIKKRSNNNQ